MKNTGTERWKKAQTYERKWWSKHLEVIDITYLRRFSEELTLQVQPYIDIASTTRILEIGSGPAGILTFIRQSDERYAVEPLEDFFAGVKKYQEFRDKKVRYYHAKGESLPFENEFFDFIIMDNVLDHCQDPVQVVREAKRVLRKEGIIYLRVNTYHFWGKWVRSIMELLEIDPGHPHTFTKAELKRLFAELKLEPVTYEHRGYLYTFRTELKSLTLKNLFKIILFATRDRTLFILRS